MQVLKNSLPFSDIKKFSIVNDVSEEETSESEEEDLN